MIVPLGIYVDLLSAQRPTNMLLLQLFDKDILAGITIGDMNPSGSNMLEDHRRMSRFVVADETTFMLYIWSF